VLDCLRAAALPMRCRRTVGLGDAVIKGEDEGMHSCRSDANSTDATKLTAYLRRIGT
jgi:hypothetical protein